MELSNIYLKLFKEKVKEFKQCMISCKDQMLDHYPFEENKERDFVKEIKIVKVKLTEMRKEFAKAGS
jgi:calcineurin-like phosphoesterase family protein